MSKIREFKYIEKQTNSSITVITYNILAPSVTKNHMTECSEECIKWDNRLNKIFKEVLNINPDIICFQEVQTDKYYTIMVSKFLKKGYYGLYVPQKSWSKNILSYNENFGIAIFIKLSRFHILKYGSIDFHRHVEKFLEKTNQLGFLSKTKKRFVGLQLLLLDKITNKKFIVCSVHLESNPKYDDIKNLQQFILLNYLQKNIVLENKLPFILTGDFNSKPNSSVYNGTITGKSHNNLFDTEDFKYPKPFINTPKIFTKYPLISCYNKVFGKEPIYTNYTENFKESLDYIFINDKIKIIGALNEVDKNYIKNYKCIPNNDYPSDHFMQSTVLEII
tara:strand:+ start:2542 stop:3543 length:1002 start_codon:yes stop_codon:yes gene_type:complete